MSEAGLDDAAVAELLERLGALGVSVQEKRNRLVVRGQPGFERDTAVQSLVARLRWHHAAYPDEVTQIVRQHVAA